MSIAHKLTVGSLFSGIGGIELGLEMTGGFRTIWQCEIDPYCRGVLARHWPGLPIYGDITQVDWADAERPDVLCGGFPCQDISVAGRGAGIKEGTRSGLWFEFARAIGALRPRYVVIENVAALVIRGLDFVLADLAEAGYDAEWTDLRASDLGAPHRRERIFIVAYPAGAGTGDHAGQAGEQGRHETSDEPAGLRQGNRAAGATGVDPGSATLENSAGGRAYPAEQGLCRAQAGEVAERAGRQAWANPDRSGALPALADADRDGAGERPGSGSQRGDAAQVRGGRNSKGAQDPHADADHRRAELAHAPGDGREQGRAEHAPRERRPAATGDGGAVADPALELPHGRGDAGPGRRGEPANGCIFQSPIPRSAFWDDCDYIRGGDGTLRAVGLRPRRVHDGIRAGVDAAMMEPIPLLEQNQPNRVARLKALGNAVVPQCAEYVGRCILAREAGCARDHTGRAPGMVGPVSDGERR